MLCLMSDVFVGAGFPMHRDNWQLMSNGSAKEVYANT
jgi:hypothetical protein